MFEIDKKRVNACIEFDDYYSAMEYSLLVVDNYEKGEREFFENIIKLVKLGETKSKNE